MWALGTPVFDCKVLLLLLLFHRIMRPCTLCVCLLLSSRDDVSVWHSLRNINVKIAVKLVRLGNMEVFIDNHTFITQMCCLDKK